MERHHSSTRKVFLFSGKYIEAGPWELISVAAEDMFGGELPIVSGNVKIARPSAETYVEGYVDRTASGLIQGWAYNSIKSTYLYPGFIGPEIYLKIKEQNTGETMEFT